MQFGGWLHNKRKEYDYTLQELADKMGTSKSVVWYLEQEDSNPKLDTLETIAKAFGMETWRMLKQVEK
ncbi:helix-turn-helix transcriptional regulator [Candidatus Pacearchaeota archaeon]|nr:helix-turn-helix transcriptional regulator [Candidatus Pacearchaeota archaeon]